MIYLVLSIICSALLSIVIRHSEKHVEGGVAMFAVNYVVCVVLSLYYSGVGKVSVQAEGFGFTMMLGSMTGVLYLAGFLLHQLNIKKNGVVMSATFMQLGLMVPVLMSAIKFDEKMQTAQIVGFVLAIGAILLINLQKDDTTMQFKIGLIFLLLVNGFANGMSKIYEFYGKEEFASHFLLFTFGVACILSVILSVAKKERITKYHFIYGFMIGVPNYYCSRFLLKALIKMPAVVAYPTSSVGGIVLVSLAGLFLFKERLSKRQWTAIGLILIALVLLNIK